MPTTEARTPAGALAGRVRRQTDEVEVFVGGLSEDAFQARPAKGRWSVAEHLAHVPLAIRPYLPVLRDAVETARARGWRSEAPSRGTWRGRLFVREMEPPPRRRSRTFRAMEPPRQVERGAALAGFADAQAGLAAVLSDAAAEGLDLGRPRVRSPFLRLLKMSAWQAVEATVAHTDRHLWLMREALDPTPPSP